jgi:ASC-1-like (ASCH) protein
MTEIRKKVWPEYFEKVLSGEKKVELRLADFTCNTGDVLVLEEWNPQTKRYTGRQIRKKVSYVMKTKDAPFWTKEEIEKYGYMILQMEDEK